MAEFIPLTGCDSTEKEEKDKQGHKLGCQLCQHDVFCTSGRRFIVEPSAHLKFDRYLCKLECTNGLITPQHANLLCIEVLHILFGDVKTFKEN